ncbi:MAG: Fe(3+) ABC transporter substrate-binding protein [Bacteroidota bacterium]
MKNLKYLAVLLVVACTSTADKNSEETDDSTEAIEAGVLNVYTHRHYDADKVAFDKFTEATGIQVNVVKAGADELINRLEMEGANSPADLLITVDAAKLNRAKAMGLLQPVEAETNNLPKFIDKDKMWYAMTYRARVIVYDRAEVDPNNLSTYEDLSSEKWDNEILIRSSTSSYNQSLLSSIIFENGKEAALDWADGVAGNMARQPKGGDRDQIKAMAADVGNLSVVNTYYVGLMLNSENREEVEVAQKVGVFFPNQDGRGAHINISGIGVTKNAPNKKNAIKFIEFMTGEEIQKFYASNSFEYPVNAQVEPDSTVAAWGEFKADDLAYADNPALLEDALEIFDEVGWN